jgi:hypothetical protein
VQVYLYGVSMYTRARIWHAGYLYVTYGRTKRSFLACKLFESEGYEQGLIFTEGSITPPVGGVR